MYVEALQNISIKQPPYFDASKIRDYELLMDDNFRSMVHFIAISDKHRMFKEDDGSVTIIKEEESGSYFFYGEPVYTEEALDILEKSNHPGHEKLAEKLRNFLN